MKIRTTHDPKPIPDRQYDWSAIDESAYDGAEDSANRHMVGYGPTEADAINDLLRIVAEDDEANHCRTVEEEYRRFCQGSYDTTYERDMDRE